jgi:hypothetical protein
MAVGGAGRLGWAEKNGDCQRRMRSAFLGLVIVIAIIWVIAVLIALVTRLPLHSDQSFKAHVIRFCKAFEFWSP